MSDEAGAAAFGYPVPVHRDWRLAWRKPAPGMRAPVLEDLAIAPRDARMIGGDPGNDPAATRAASMPFRWAHRNGMLD